MVAVWAQVCKPVSDYKKRQERREEAIPGGLARVLLPLAQDSAMSFKVETDIGWAKDSFFTSRRAVQSTTPPQSQEG